MTPEQFIYWFQGFCERDSKLVPTQEQWDSIWAHLSTVFNKVTPPIAPSVAPPVTPSGANRLLNERISRAAEKAVKEKQQLTPLGEPKDIIPFWPQHPSAPFMPQSPLGPFGPNAKPGDFIC